MVWSAKTVSKNFVTISFQCGLVNPHKPISKSFVTTVSFKYGLASPHNMVSKNFAMTISFTFGLVSPHKTVSKKKCCDDWRPESSQNCSQVFCDDWRPESSQKGFYSWLFWGLRQWLQMQFVTKVMMERL